MVCCLPAVSRFASLPGALLAGSLVPLGKRPPGCLARTRLWPRAKGLLAPCACRLLRSWFHALESQGGGSHELSLNEMAAKLTRSEAARLFAQILGGWVGGRAGRQAGSSKGGQVGGAAARVVKAASATPIGSWKSFKTAPCCACCAPQ